MKKRVKIRQVQVCQDVWDAVVHPSLIRIPVVLSWGPSGCIRKESGSDAHKARESRVVVRFSAARARNKAVAARIVMVR